MLDLGNGFDEAIKIEFALRPPAKVIFINGKPYYKRCPGYKGLRLGMYL